VKKILAALDGSPCSREVLDRALQAARSDGAKLQVLTVVSDAPMTAAEIEVALRESQPEVSELVVQPAFVTAELPGGDAAERQDLVSAPRNLAIRQGVARHILSNATAMARKKGVSPFETLLKAGDPAAVILDVLAAERPDLLIIGSRGLGRRAGGLMGSVSGKVSKNSPCPVVVVEPDKPES
jgi:nucleotide-binding universal stress UspA family protein